MFEGPVGQSRRGLCATVGLRNCVPCERSINGEGAPLGSALNLNDVMAKDDDFLRTIILEGIPETAMIDFEARMSAQEVDDVMAFMLSWASAASSEAPAPVPKPTLLPIPTATQETSR